MNTDIMVRWEHRRQQPMQGRRESGRSLRSAPVFSERLARPVTSVMSGIWPAASRKVMEFSGWTGRISRLTDGRMKNSLGQSLKACMSSTHAITHPVSTRIICESDQPKTTPMTWWIEGAAIGRAGLNARMVTLMSRGRLCGQGRRGPTGRFITAADAMSVGKRRVTGVLGKRFER